MNNLIKTCYYFKDIDAHYATMRKLESLYFQKYTASLAETPCEHGMHGRPGGPEMPG